MSQNITRETKWLCEHAHALEQFSGKWVLFSAREGLVANSGSLQKILSAARNSKKTGKPFIFHVPSKQELGLFGVNAATS